MSEDPFKVLSEWTPEPQPACECPEDECECGPPLIAPLTGYDLFLLQKYAPKRPGA